MGNIESKDILHLYNQKYRYFQKEMNQRLRKYDLYASQWTILYCLDQSGPITQTDIWKYLNIEAPTVTRTLSRLEKNGWVERLPGQDKREKMIYLTEEAKTELPKIKRTMKQFDDDVLHRLDQGERKLLYQLLSKLTSEV
ncbi:MarR family winged helix-turn-helix transcriptional regulator [Oceanobacillus kimchii]|uniref:MarR family winged helix-turn-helix transcriptional regulator n=1 Tax=Oceanobacillus kimchii TaxID=746691 RepID=UPI002330EA0C|nr:MarR family transcriptional regulator [Oceanobacillus kimchii]